MKKLLSVFVPAVIALCWLRVRLKLYAVDAATGFYMDEPALVTAFGIILLAGLVVIIALGYGSDYTALEKFHKSRKAGMAALIPVSIVLGVKSVISLIDILQNGARLRSFSIIAEAVGVIAAICLIKIALEYFSGIKERVSFFISVVPVLYSLLILVKRFYLYNSINSISDQMLEVLFYAALTSLFLEQIRVVSQMGIAKGLKSVVPSGLACALTGFVLVSGQFAARLNGTSSAVDSGLPELVFITLTSIYAVVFSVISMKAYEKKKQSF